VVVGIFIAQALTGLGKGLGFSVTLMGLDTSPERFPAADRVIDTLDFSGLEIGTNAYIVVASHGNYDEDALAAALRTKASYVALVASKARAQAMLEYLRDSGLTEADLGRLKFPAGLDLGAVTPEESAQHLAVSFAARLFIVTDRCRCRCAAPAKPSILFVDDCRDRLARYVTNYNGQTYYFCAKGCQRSFEAEPERFVNPIGAG
jgi:xanthine dehydrogenase accessory factor